MSRWSLERELYRKAVHVLLCMLLLLPFYVEMPLHLDAYYGLGLFLAALINSFAAKRIQLLEDLRSIEEGVASFRRLLEKHMGEPIRAIEEQLTRIERFALEQISMLERDYEKKEGYVGLLYGMIGVSTTYLLFPSHIYYGALALLVVDPIASLAGMATGETRRPPLHGSISGFTASTTVFALLLYIAGMPASSAVLVSLAASGAELLSVEDNLTIPFAASLAAWLLGLPGVLPLSGV